ncbi:MAG: RnfH family protein [Nevskiales bacterium]
MPALDLIEVEVAYARPDRQVLVTLELPRGATLLDAVRKSGLLQQFPEIELEQATLGVFGKIKPGSELLNGGDRVEIYRPLVADPKQARRRRAAED